MTKTKPRLVTFGISHYCEKARWALDWHGIDYEEVSWAPGLHQIFAKRCGAEGTALPILLLDESIIQGSDKIIDWADKNTPHKNRTLTHSDSRTIERRADDAMSVHIRRLSFARMLPQSAHLVKPAFLQHTTVPHRLAGSMMWPVAVRVMMRAYDVTTQASAESRDRLNVELDWVESMLSDGRRYLAGNSFSRADIAVATPLAHIARPAEHGRFYPMPLNETLKDDYALWLDRPAISWVRDLYRTRKSMLEPVAA